MRNFITNYLMALMDYKDKDVTFKSGAYKRKNSNDVVKILGRVSSGLADFTITRFRPDGTSVSSKPVFGMPLTKAAIESLASTAIESL